MDDDKIISKLTSKASMISIFDIRLFQEMQKNIPDIQLIFFAPFITT
ncbi:hypothetical protein pb186bvf_016687 [Paramecium bursaria]